MYNKFQRRLISIIVLEENNHKIKMLLRSLTHYKFIITLFHLSSFIIYILFHCRVHSVTSIHEDVQGTHSFEGETAATPILTNQITLTKAQ